MIWERWQNNYRWGSHSINYNCLPILLCGLECVSLINSDLKSLDFTINEFLMKLFKSLNIELINECRQLFAYAYPANWSYKDRTAFHCEDQNLPKFAASFWTNCFNFYRLLLCTLHLLVILIILFSCISEFLSTIIVRGEWSYIVWCLILFRCPTGTDKSHYASLFSHFVK